MTASADSRVWHRFTSRQLYHPLRLTGAPVTSSRRIAAFATIPSFPADSSQNEGRLAKGGVLPATTGPWILSEMIGSNDCAGPYFSGVICQSPDETPAIQAFVLLISAVDRDRCLTKLIMPADAFSLDSKKRKPRLPQKPRLSYVKSLDECDGRVA